MAEPARPVRRGLREAGVRVEPVPHEVELADAGSEHGGEEDDGHWLFLEEGGGIAAEEVHVHPPQPDGGVGGDVVHPLEPDGGAEPGGNEPRGGGPLELDGGVELG